MRAAGRPCLHVQVAVARGDERHAGADALQPVHHGLSATRNPSPPHVPMLTSREAQRFTHRTAGTCCVPVQALFPAAQSLRHGTCSHARLQAGPLPQEVQVERRQLPRVGILQQRIYLCGAACVPPQASSGMLATLRPLHSTCSPHTSNRLQQAYDDVIMPQIHSQQAVAHPFQNTSAYQLLPYRQAFPAAVMQQSLGSGRRARAGGCGLLMGRSWTMFRLGPRQVNVRKGFDSGGAPCPTGTALIDSFTCRATPCCPHAALANAHARIACLAHLPAGHTVCAPVDLQRAWFVSCDAAPGYDAAACQGIFKQIRRPPQGCLHHLRQPPAARAAAGLSRTRRQ